MAIKWGKGKWYEWPAGGLFSSKDEETNPYGQLNPEQIATTKQLGPLLQSYLGKGPSYYTGQLTEPIGTAEQEAISRNARLSALGEQGLEPLLRGEFPEDYYQQSIYKPMMKQYTEDIQPLIEEQYTGTGGYWGSARAGAVGKGYRDLTDTLAAKRAELGWEAQKNIPTAVNAANALAAQETATQAIPRTVKQLGLDKIYTDYLNANTAYGNWVNQALNFLGISTGTYKPEEASPFEQMLPEILKLAATAAGAGA